MTAAESVWESYFNQISKEHQNLLYGVTGSSFTITATEEDYDFTKEFITKFNNEQEDGGPDKLLISLGFIVYRLYLDKNNSTISIHLG